MALDSVRSLIIHKEHILLAAGNVDDVLVSPGPLLDVPYNRFLCLLAIELRPAESPEFREIEFVLPALIIKG